MKCECLFSLLYRLILSTYNTNGSVIERLGCLSAMCRETLRQYGVLRRILSSLGGSRTVPRCGTLDYKGVWIGLWVFMG